MSQSADPDGGTAASPGTASPAPASPAAFLSLTQRFGLLGPHQMIPTKPAEPPTGGAPAEE